MLFFLKDVFPILLYDFVKPIKNGKFAKYDNLGKLRHGRLALALAVKQNGNEKSDNDNGNKTIHFISGIIGGKHTITYILN